MEALWKPNSFIKLVNMAVGHEVLDMSNVQAELVNVVKNGVQERRKQLFQAAEQAMRHEGFRIISQRKDRKSCASKKPIQFLAEATKKRPEPEGYGNLAWFMIDANDDCIMIKNNMLYDVRRAEALEIPQEDRRAFLQQHVNLKVCTGLYSMQY